VLKVIAHELGAMVMTQLHTGSDTFREPAEFSRTLWPIGSSA
jgi:hypothetical protein